MFVFLIILVLFLGKSTQNEVIPLHFDARLAWPKCSAVISHISDQGRCGSCWAVSSTDAMSDRLCIASKGTTQVRISAVDLLECCKTCADGKEDLGGCYGGDPYLAWQYFAKHGLSTEHCKPYPVPPCEKNLKTGLRPVCFLDKNKYQLDKCKLICRSTPPITYQSDLHYAKTYYKITSRNVTEIQLEILRHGPVVASYNVYEDFLAYKSGVYVRKASAKYIVGHAVRVLGWGTENGTDYWLAANSWNTDWGRLKGVFKIKRGSNECGFEEELSAGIVKV